MKTKLITIELETNHSMLLEWVEEYQKGKSGIYPHQVAQLLSVEFTIPIEIANLVVLTHIHQVLKGEK